MQAGYKGLRAMSNSVSYTPRAVVLCGPSGSGKSTLIDLLKRDDGECFGFSVSHTTRNPRPKEQNGVHYHFTTREKMAAAIENGEFIEHANVSGNFYGTSKKAVQDVLNQHKMCILDIDVQGVLSVRATDLDPMYIFIKPPTFTALEERLRNRKTESEDAIQRRLNTAKKELEFINEEEEKGSYVVVNDVIEPAYQRLRDILKDDISKLKEYWSKKS